MIVSAQPPKLGLEVAGEKALSTRRVFKLLRKRLKQVAERGLRANNEGVKEIHRLRVATRKALAAVAVCKPLLRKGVAKRLESALVKQRRAVGKVRDWDVLISNVLCTPADEKAEVRCELLYFLAKQRKRALKKSRADWSKAARSLARPGDIEPIEKALKNSAPLRLFAEALKEPMAALRKGNVAKVAGDQHDMKKLHAQRIACKQLRYLIELREEALGAGGESSTLDLLTQAQKRLGDLHDGAQRAKLLSQVKRPRSKGVRNWIDVAINTAQMRVPLEVGRYLTWQAGANLEKSLEALENSFRPSAPEVHKSQITKDFQPIG